MASTITAYNGGSIQNGRYSEYLRTNRFKVLMPRGEENPEWFESYLIDIDLPSISFETAEWWDGTVFNRMMTKGVFGDVSMTLYMGIYSNPFYHWILRHVQHAQGQFKYAKVSSSESYKKDLLIQLLDGNGEPRYTYQLENCQLKAVSLERLSYSSNGEVLKGTLTITPDRVLLPTASPPDKLRTAAEYAQTSADWEKMRQAGGLKETIKLGPMNYLPGDAQGAENLFGTPNSSGVAGGFQFNFAPAVLSPYE